MAKIRSFNFPAGLLSLQTLAEENLESETKNLRTIGDQLLEKSQTADGKINYIELNPRIICFPLKTETLPPATHTNCFVAGRKKFIVIDAASEEETEQTMLHALVDSLIEKNCECQAIVTTHLHRDHFGGEITLQKHLFEKFGLQIPLAAHRLTAESLAEKIEFQKFIEDGEAFDLQDETGADFRLKIIHTPGHARGLLAFYDEEFGFLLSSDNVVSSSSVVIAPPEGNLKSYLASLEKLRDLPNLRFLCGSHGAAVFGAQAKIESFITHRLEREQEIVEAMQNGAQTVGEIVEKVYVGLKPELLKLAEKSVEAHLEKLREGKKI
jgi:ribonuclease/clavin/mitogillin